MKFIHKTILLKETLESLCIIPKGIYVDGTAGGGGLSFEIASRLSENGCLICIDQDPDAISECKNKLKKFPNVDIVESNFINVIDVVHSLGLQSVDGVTLDLGVSSYQLDAPERGFSYKKDAPLDMRMNKSGKSAYDAVNFLDYVTLRKIISYYGEERFASRIANAIVREREKGLIKSTLELVKIISDAVPFAAKRDKHPARKTFQALRIYVNNELENLGVGLENAFEILNKNGRLAVITFHSLEDKIVKHKMAKWLQGCVCPSDFPVCVCKKTPRAKMVYKRAIEPTLLELEGNPRSRSAKLRVCEKLN